MGHSMPDEIKVRFAARQNAHPTKVIWALFCQNNWYVFAQSPCVAKRRMEWYLNNGDKIFTEVTP